MNKNYNIIEVTKDNKDEYLSSIAQLEELVLKNMEKNGKVGQLFITGKDGIEEYIDTDSNHVLIAVTGKNPKKQVISAAYITQGQIDFTYNDITKYFKYGNEYLEYIKSKYSENEFKKVIRKVYIEKICAFKYARNAVLQELGIKENSDVSEQEKNEILLKLIDQEYNNPQNQFHEKSEIRDNLNKYMSLYMKVVKKDLRAYQEFYWIDFNYLKKYFNKEKLQGFMNESNLDSTIKAYDKILQYQKYKIYDRTHCQNMSQYFGANTENTVELDTYITRPDSRENGIARILVLEGIKKSINRILKNKDNKEIFLVSTLHEENLSSKYVSEFFGLKDYLFLNRRSGRDRQVHIWGMKREEFPKYIATMEKKIAVLYDYNPSKILITEEERRKIIQEQIEYEVQELQRLKGIKDIGKMKKYKGYIDGKQTKIQNLQELMERRSYIQSRIVDLKGGLYGK